MRKLERKTKIILTAAILLLAVVMVIFVIPFYHLPAPVSLWEKKQLEEEYNRVHDWPPMWMDQNDKIDFTYYFGEYNGYYIISDKYDICWHWDETVGDYEFEYGNRSISALKKDGTFYELSDLYARGEISDKDLAKIYEYYLETKKILNNQFCGDE